jgi:hypothetical protein
MIPLIKFTGSADTSSGPPAATAMFNVGFDELSTSTGLKGSALFGGAAFPTSEVDVWLPDDFFLVDPTSATATLPGSVTVLMWINATDVSGRRTLVVGATNIVLRTQ